MSTSEANQGNGNVPNDAGEEKKKITLQGLKNKLTAGGAKMAAGAIAGTANLNAAMVAGGERMRQRLAELSSDDDEEQDSSDEEMEELWGTTTSADSTTPDATAIAVRLQPAVDFISVEEEDRIRNELKDAKALRKKMRKVKKVVKKSIKAARVLVETNGSVLTALHTSADSRCADPSITELLASAKQRLQTVSDSPTLDNYNAVLTDQLLEQVKPVSDHAKVISVKGKARRIARDRRIRLALEEVDVSNEEAYNRSAEVVREFSEMDAAYKDEFVNFREHTSSQLGQMLRSYLLESATYLETLAAAMREAAGSNTANYFLSADCCNRYKDFKADAQYLSPIPALFSNIAPDGVSADVDRLTAKPSTTASRTLAASPPPAPPAVAGIPMSEENYGTSTYSRLAEDTRVRESLDNFILTGQLPGIASTVVATEGRNTPRETSAVKQKNAPIPSPPPAVVARSVHDPANGRLQPADPLDSATANRTLMDYIYSLANEYGIEPDFPVMRGKPSSASSSSAIRPTRQTPLPPPWLSTPGEGRAATAPVGSPNIASRPTSATPNGSLFLPSLTASAPDMDSSPYSAFSRHGEL